ncbi:type II toxin-antitoxin system Phd/YefM family antitoxin [Salinarimonas sp. NSM]|uniref:type II toxin-antitoxin system Phd/YefM family antitoxin n=1 Tax=Salinarimonas sp. NSM TaxID=3458003 RepID=UPI0040353B23
MWTLQDAKNRFSRVVDDAMSGTPQRVTRRGKPAVVVVEARQYDLLVEQARAGRGSFAEHLLAFPGDLPLDRADLRPREVDL